MLPKKIFIYDTTLRDGAQMQGISLSVSDKLKIVKILDSLGVDYIEGGWPGANPKDIEFFEAVRSLDLKCSKLVAFGCTRRVDSEDCSVDPIMQGLLSAETDVVTIVAKTWDLHVEVALRTSLDNNLTIIRDSIQYLKSHGKEVILDAEHFFDGYIGNSSYSRQIIEVAMDVGVDSIVLCDTNGGTLPFQIEEIVSELVSLYPQCQFGIHTHNDGGLAVANTLAAVRGGVQQIQGTINGYGERCGNADLVASICNLQLKMGYEALPSSEHLQKITHASKAISSIVNINPDIHHPFVGRAAFGHKGGLHASAMLRNRETYEHVDPLWIGNESRIIVSEQAGLSNISDFAANKNIDIPDPQLARDILALVKEREQQGYQYESASASLELLFLGVLGKSPHYFELVDFRVLSWQDHMSEASVQVRIKDQNLHVVSFGVGPGHALDSALRKALDIYYGQLAGIRLNDFKVRVVDSHDGTAAKTQVVVESIFVDTGVKWSTIGVHQNILEATLEAITSSIEYGLYKLGVQPIN